MLAHILGALIGTGLSKACSASLLLESSQWAICALASAVTAAIMSLAKVLHAPAGATALLVAMEPSIVALGWVSLPVVLFGYILVEGTDFLMANVEGMELLRLIKMNVRALQPVSSTTEICSGDPCGLHSEQETAETVSQVAGDNIIVKSGHISVPEHFRLEEKELELLRTLSGRI